MPGEALNSQIQLSDGGYNKLYWKQKKLNERLDTERRDILPTQALKLCADMKGLPKYVVSKTSKEKHTKRKVQDSKCVNVCVYIYYLLYKRIK
jgi:hypothetical protein